jgi:tripartite-type tricarboxylate transporter receptor subunit TctC
MLRRVYDATMKDPIGSARGRGNDGLLQSGRRRKHAAARGQMGAQEKVFQHERPRRKEETKMSLAAWARATGAVATWFCLALPWPCLAQSADDPTFPKGTQLTLGIASTPGGGYDSYGRLVARHIGKYLPGQPAVVPTNMTGAGGNVLARYMTDVAPRDGTWFALVLPATVTGGLYQERSKLGYDPSKLVHLGSANSEIDMCFVRADAGIRNLAEARDTQVVLGASAEGGATREQPAVLNHILGTKFKIISGYPGTREIILAIEKGEVSGVCGISYSGMKLQRPEWLDSGFIRPVSQNHVEGSPALTAQGVLRAVDLVKSPEDRQVLELIYSQQVFGRPFVMAEGVPQARVRVLRKALIEVLKDDQLRADAERMRLDINPVSGEALQALVEKLYATAPHIIRRAAEALKGQP